ncbi:MAG: hypothetical protein K0Q49_271 [Haloplasmataceae bacterium]|jgi:predicted nucleotide-binding protein (sugar kinase/HSP70/actin superfamily)|nr:hypothetical protein [Haloplasmataceae bacterium]
MKIGIPRALLFYEYSPLWIAFFSNLGAEVVLSEQTNKRVLHQGTQTTVDDACIPVKLYHGHVLNLKDKVDYIFVPRIMGVSKGDFICPKFCGIPEMIKNSLTDIPKMINTTIDFTKTDKHFNDTIIEIGKYITKDENKILSSYDSALSEFNLYKDKLKQGQLPTDTNNINIFESNNRKIMLMGHPYNIYDNFINMNVIKKLRDDQYDVITPEMIDDNITSEYALQYDGKIFWNFARKLIGSCLYEVEKKQIDGMIYICSFGCGIDSIVSEIVERRIRKANIPFMLITIDEHSGEAGFNTRLEAFTDMIKWRHNLENNLSTHG